MSFAWLDSKYLSLLSFRLRNFKRKGSAWNFSCPYCGDSKTDKRKARGYVYNRKGKLRYYCHNCGIPNVDIPRLIQHLDQSLYDEYIKEKLMADPQKIEKTDVQIFADKMKKPTFIKDTPLRKLKKISAFSADSVVKKYIDRRKIPTKYHYKLFFCKEFKKWVNEFKPGQFESIDNDEPRLIIPFLDKEGNLFAIQGRSFRKNTNLRYITIMFNEEKPKLYGLDTIDDRLPIYVVEGPIDSMFIPNCIASAGSDVTTNLNSISEDKSKFIIVYDNEPRNVEIVRKIEKSIDAGFPVCIWPESMEQKDINDMILSGLKTRQVVNIINNNTFTDLSAKLKFQQWKKV
jgi:transcription elongation factor Elf1